MTDQELKDKLFEIISLPVNIQVHENYQRVCDLAVLYSQIISGKDIDCLLKQFVRREDDIMFEQRKNLTQQITPSISNGIIKTFNKVFRTAPAKESIDFDGDSVDDKIQEVKEALSVIYGNKDIYKYMQDRFSYLSFCDPNAFIYTTFDPFNSKKEKPIPFNLEISSTAAINYEYFNNTLQWLISRVEITYTEGKKQKEGYIYTIYGPEWAFVMTQVGKDYVALEGEEVVEIKREKETLRFILVEYEHKAQIIPLIQVGYERDLETMGVTYVSPIHAAMPYFMKLIKVVSEFDLTNALHVFPKLFQYVDKCEFVSGKCQESGFHQDRCLKCNKTGIKVHKSAQDAILLKMPSSPEDMHDLSKMIHVETPDVNLLEFQDKLINEYAVKVIKAVFNSETFTRDQIAKTATGENIDMQNVYDTLKPFAEKVSDFWEQVAYVTANYLDFKDPIVDHAYPNDFKLKTDAELLDELSKAYSGGAAGHVVSAIESDIMRLKYIDKPNDLKVYEARKQFFPFNGKTKDEINIVLMSNFVRPRDIILYNYFDNIFAELEKENDSKKIWFYALSYDKQLEQIDEKIASIKADLEGARQLDLGEMVS